MGLTRRHFLGASAAAVVAAGAMTKGKVYGANEKIGMCVVGINGRGGSHISAWLGSQDSELVAVCDVDENVLKRIAAEIKNKSGKEVKTYVDMRDALADSDVDGISIATPNGWHTLAAIWACEAGKDVYVEKPASHEIWEGQQLAAAAKKYNRIVQHGTQNRSNATWIRDMQLLHSGEIIGPVYMARGLGYKNGNRGSLGSPKDCDPPEGLHWDLWQGPATRKPFNPAYHPYSWHWFWHYGNGEIGNQGVHQMDVGVWGMNRGLPVKVYSTGGRYTYQDIGETPNTQIATFTYADGTVFVFEVRNRFTNSEGGVKIGDQVLEGVNVGNLFYAEAGYYVEGQGFYDTRNQPIPVDDAKYPKPATAGPFQNFLNAVKSRNEADNFANMDIAHVSCAHCHLANIAYRLGMSLEIDPEKQVFVGQGAEEANKMLKREYAEGFEVPQLA
ncbi:MAG: Gfo/Idh/MocA family oxidoreductase [Candidatus Hydrogenedentes bacterium]|nr:Gfo/Idh/MocA family oxidoreductase [Candidatus Hydrogenedentota bacterium]